MRKKIFMPALVLSLLAGSSVLAAKPEIAPAPDKSMREAILETIKANPDAIFSVLRSNPAEVLKIAQEGSQELRKQAIMGQWDGELKKEKKYASEKRLAKGKGKIRLAAFSDFTCGFCAQSEETLKNLQKKYGGDLEIIFKPIPSPDNKIGRELAAWVAAASLQDMEKAWALHDLIFANQRLLVQNGDNLSATLAPLAESLKFDVDRIKKDMAGKEISDMLDQDLKDAASLGIQGTPFFLIGNLPIGGAVPQDIFEAAIEKVKAGPKPDAKPAVEDKKDGK